MYVPTVEALVKGTYGEIHQQPEILFVCQPDYNLIKVLKKNDGTKQRFLRFSVESAVLDVQAVVDRILLIVVWEEDIEISTDGDDIQSIISISKSTNVLSLLTSSKSGRESKGVSSLASSLILWTCN